MMVFVRSYSRKSFSFSITSRLSCCTDISQKKNRLALSLVRFKICDVKDSSIFCGGCEKTSQKMSAKQPQKKKPRAKVVLAIVGEPQKRYGLQTPSEAPPVARIFARASSSAADAAAAPLPAPAIAAAVASGDALRAAAAAEQAKVLAEDPTAYEYDSLYDSLHPSSASKQKQKQQQQQQRTQREAQYMGALQQTAARRRRFLEVAFDRKMQREAERERAEFGETEAFVTASYRRRLAEDRRWEEEEDARDAAQGTADAAGRSRNTDLSEFHAHMLADFAAARAGTTAPAQALSTVANPSPSSAAAVAAAAALKQKHPSGSDHHGRAEEALAIPSAPASTVAQPPDPSDAKEAERRERAEERARLEKRRRENEEEYRAAMESRAAAAAQAAESKDAKLARRTTSESVATARERYLARKAAMAKELEEARAAAANK